MTLLVIVDILLTVGALVIRRRCEKTGKVDFSTALSAVIGAATIHVAAWLPFARHLLSHGEGNFDAGTGFMIMGALAVPGFIPMILYGVLLRDAASHSAVESLYGLDTGKPAPSDYSKARALVKQEQVIAAVRQYRRYFEENPKEPEPLFEAAGVLAKKKRVKEAIGILREIRDQFVKDDAVWVRATFLLAELHQNNAGNNKAAQALLKEIVQRAPRTQYGRDANERLTRLNGMRR